MIKSLLIIVGLLAAILTVASGLIWLERRLLALWQDRYGPNRVGPFGILQVFADVIKILMKEDWIPPLADAPVFVIAPAITVTTTLMSFAIIVFAPGITVVDLGIGVLFFLAMSSLGVYSLVLGGWSSNNKYSLLGGLRAAAQMLSYELFMGLSLMGVVMLAGSFNICGHRRRRRETCGSASLSSLVWVCSSLPGWQRRTDCPSTFRKRTTSLSPAITASTPA